MPVDIRDALERAAGQPTGLPDVEAIRAGGRRLLWRRRATAMALVAALAAVASTAYLSGAVEDLWTRTIAPASQGADEAQLPPGVSAIPLGGEPIDVAVGLGAVWAAVRTTEGTKLVGIDPSSDRPVGNGGLIDGEVIDLEAGEGSVWALVAGTLSGGPATVVALDPATGAQRTVRLRGPEGRSASDLAVGNGGVWIGHGTLTRVTRLDPDSLEKVATVETGVRAIVLASGDDGLWVWSGAAITPLVRISPERNAVVARYPGFDLGALTDSAVWVRKWPSSERIGRLDPRTGRFFGPFVTAGRSPLVARGDELWLAAPWTGETDGETEPALLLGRLVPHGDQTFLLPGALGTEPLSGFGSIWAISKTRQALLRVAPDAQS